MFPSNPNPFNQDKYPRLTSPTGTFLSNPSTAADGIFGGTQVSNVPQIGAQVGTPEGVKNTSAFGGGGFTDWLKSIFTPKNNYTMPGVDYNKNPNYTPYPGAGINQPKEPYVPYPGVNPKTPAPQPTQAFTPTSASPNDLVGKEIGSTPNFMSNETLQQMFPGRNAAEIQQLMLAKGYTFQAANKPGLSGGTWVLTNPQASKEAQAQAPITSFGNQFVDPTLLARGERVQISPGYNIVGGTPTTKDQGNTPAGTSQYAVTIGTVNKKLDEKGAYKWVSHTVRDKNGNWVRVNEKVLRGPYSKGGRQQQEMRREEQAAAQQEQKSPEPKPVEYNQLINMRVNYG